MNSGASVTPSLGLMNSCCFSSNSSSIINSKQTVQTSKSFNLVVQLGAGRRPGAVLQSCMVGVYARSLLAMSRTLSQDIQTRLWMGEQSFRHQGSLWSASDHKKAEEKESIYIKPKRDSEHQRDEWSLPVSSVVRDLGSKGPSASRGTKDDLCCPTLKMIHGRTAPLCLADEEIPLLGFRKLQ